MVPLLMMNLATLMPSPWNDVDIHADIQCLHHYCTSSSRYCCLLPLPVWTHSVSQRERSAKLDQLLPRIHTTNKKKTVKRVFQHTISEMIKAIFDIMNAAPAKNANFDRNSCANIATTANPPTSPCCCFFFFRPANIFSSIRKTLHQSRSLSPLNDITRKCTKSMDKHGLRINHFFFYQLVQICPWTKSNHWNRTFSFGPPATDHCLAA